MHSIIEGHFAGNSGGNIYLLKSTKKIKIYKDLFFNSLSGKFTVGCKVVANKKSGH